MIANGAISRVQRYKKMLNKFNLDEKQISMNVFVILATKLMTQIDIMMKQIILFAEKYAMRHKADAAIEKVSADDVCSCIWALTMGSVLKTKAQSLSIRFCTTCMAASIATA